MNFQNYQNKNDKSVSINVKDFILARNALQCTHFYVRLFFNFYYFVIWFDIFIEPLSSFNDFINIFSNDKQLSRSI